MLEFQHLLEYLTLVSNRKICNIGFKQENMYPLGFILKNYILKFGTRTCVGVDF